MAETTAWYSHCQLITFIAFLFTVTIRYDTIEEINVDSKAEYTA